MFYVASVLKFKLIFFVFIVFLFFPCRVYSFSLGEIAVKSSFGEKFHAELIINNDAKKGLKVFIGNSEDYTTVGAKLSKTVDELYIVEPIEFVSFKQQLIKIVSDKPLFYPSFELVIKAELNGGTILEKYSLAADFKKNMSLLLSPPESKEKILPETIELSKAISEKDKIKFLPPLKEKDTKLAAKEAKKKRIKSGEVVKVEIATGIGVQISAKGSITYEVSRGENLSTIVKKVKPQKSGFYRAVVALWRLNKDQFAHGNINALKAGARLSFDNFEEEIRKVSVHEAARILHNHQAQRKKSRSAAGRILEKAVVSRISQKEESLVALEARRITEKSLIRPVPLPLPGENLAATDDVLEIISDWRKSWEIKDLKKHFSYYSEDFLSHNYLKKGIDLAGWKQYKSRITEQNNNINIEIKNLHIRKQGNQVIVSFLQKFASDSFISIGTKTLIFERKNEKLKITKETFRNEETEIIYKQYPFVIHTSSHQDWAEAINAGNRLREAGFAACIIKSTIRGKGIWFRVVIDRFRSREDANLIARKLIKEGFSKYASVLRLPYAISLGSFKNEAEAYNSVRRFRKRKFSPYLFSRGEEKEIIHHVLVGGYINKKQAMKVSESLSKKGVPHKVILP